MTLLLPNPFIDGDTFHEPIIVPDDQSFSEELCRFLDESCAYSLEEYSMPIFLTDPSPDFVHALMPWIEEERP